MSHKATTWLAGVDPDRMTSGGFRVLFYLCDCHNPSDGCFPSQAYLLKKTGLSNSGLNKVLADLEANGLISRHRRSDPKTKKKRPTRYMLAFEKGFQPMLSASADFGSEIEKPTPQSGDGAVSTLGGEPSPLQGKSRLHRCGDKPVKEPVNNQRARGNGATSCDDIAAFWAEKIKAGRRVVASAISVQIARRILELKLCSEEELKKNGVAF
ncbi:MAG: helix-turn-helix domain-containing protein [Roseobacter sp.]